MKTIRWGMIGCGDVTEVKSGPGFYKAENSTLAAVMRRNGALAKDYAARHKVPRWHTDADAIIKDPDIDAVYIATMTDTHHEYALRCAAAKKPIYCEKPMAMSYAQCCEMIGAAKANGVPLWVGYYRRALPRYLKVKELIEEGAIGDVRAVTSQVYTRLVDTSNPYFAWRTDPKQSGGGLFFEGACHTLDMLDFLFGPIVEARGFASNKARAYAGEDLVTTTYRFQSGVHGVGIWCYTTDREYEMNEIVGSRGRIQYSTAAPGPLRLLRGDKVEDLGIVDPPHLHQPMIQSIVNELNGIGHCPSTGESAARTAWVMEQVLGEFYQRN